MPNQIKPEIATKKRVKKEEKELSSIQEMIEKSSIKKEAMDKMVKEIEKYEGRKLYRPFYALKERPTDLMFDDVYYKQKSWHTALRIILLITLGILIPLTYTKLNYTVHVSDLGDLILLRK